MPSGSKIFVYKKGLVKAFGNVLLLLDNNNSCKYFRGYFTYNLKMFLYLLLVPTFTSLCSKNSIVIYFYDELK